jgi:hypothetical protein
VERSRITLSESRKYRWVPGFAEVAGCSVERSRIAQGRNTGPRPRSLARGPHMAAEGKMAGERACDYHAGPACRCHLQELGCAEVLAKWAEMK